MGDLLEFLPFGAVAVPTVLLALWPRGRRFAHFPLAALIVVIGALVSFQMGTFLRAASLESDRNRCGDPFFIPLVCLVAIGAWTFGTGAAFTIWKPTRGLGWRILTWVLPAFALTCFLCGTIGRYGPW